MRKRALHHAQPPDDLIGEMGSELVAAHAHPEAPRWISRALARFTDTSDTHPSLTDRLKALGVPPADLAPIEQSAAEVFLGQTRAEVTAALSSTWSTRVGEAQFILAVHLKKLNDDVAEVIGQLATSAPFEQPLLVMVCNAWPSYALDRIDALEGARLK